MLKEYEITPVDSDLVAQMQGKIDIKTKPPGSLGRLETLACQLAGAQGTLEPKADPCELLLFAGDHGLVAEGVSAWPSEVTAQMVLNFLAGGAAANVFAETNNATITIIDAGVAGDLPDHPRLVRSGMPRGTKNAMHEDAMDHETLEKALTVGANMAQEKCAAGANVIALGEMGIGNTSSASLLAHAVAGLDLNTLAGPGAGLDEAGVKRKAAILKKVAARRPGKLSSLEALSAFGGFEIAMMTGAIIGTAASRKAVIVDGFISTAAALCAINARPEALPYCVFSHRSEEPGHALMTSAIGVEPLIDLNLRLGEGTGALLALPLLRAACNMASDMATFESAGVSGKE